MIWLLGLPVPPALVLVFAGVTLPAALIAATIGVRLVRSAIRPGPRGPRAAWGLLGGVLVGYGVGDVAVLVYFLLFWTGELVPKPG